MIRGPVPLVLALAAALAAAGCGSSPASPSGPQVSPLPAGTYNSVQFRPRVAFTLPDGWEWPTDAGAYLQVRPAGSDIAGIHLFRDAVAASQDPACPSAAEPGVGTTSTELVAWIRERPGLVVSTPAMATVGGLRGVVIDVGIADGWTASCPFANGAPTVPLINGGGAGYHWIVAGSERMRLYVLDLPGGGNVIVDVDAFDGRVIDELIRQATPIVKSLQFTVE